MSVITIDKKDYDLSNISSEAQDQLNNIKFVDEQILQLNNELQVAQTAQIGYSRALKRELQKMNDK